MDGLPGFILAGCALAASPGPATLSLAAAGAAFGADRSLRYLGGIVAGMIAVMGITATGVTGMILALPGAAPVATAAAAAYFAYLALRIATAPPLAAGDRQARTPSFAGGALLSLLNPKGYAAMGAMFSGFALVPGRVEADIAAKILVLTGIITAASVTWLVSGTWLTRYLREPRLNRAVNLAFAVLLLVSVALAFLV